MNRPFVLPSNPADCHLFNGSARFLAEKGVAFRYATTSTLAMTHTERADPIHKQTGPENWQLQPNGVMCLLVASRIAPNENDLLLRQP